MGRSPGAPHGRAKGEGRRRREEHQQQAPTTPGSEPPPPPAARGAVAAVRLAGHGRDGTGRGDPRVGRTRRAGAHLVLQTGDAGKVFFSFV